MISLHRMEERAGERRLVLSRIPLSSVLSPFVPHGERKKNRVLRQSLPLCFLCPNMQVWRSGSSALPIAREFNS